MPRTAVPRATLLVALAAATIAVPVLNTTGPVAGALVSPTAAPDHPSAYEILSGPVEQVTPTSLLAAVSGAVRVSNLVSRSIDRDPLPGCDGVPRTGSENGAIPAEDLCTLWDGVNMLRGDAAVSLAELNLNLRAAIGRDLCITDAYRTLAEQRRLAATRGGLAATPGKSNHGWGLAIDLCSSEIRNSTVMSWLSANGPTFGWTNPDWALRGGSGPYEPWHWEYLPGTTELGTDYSND